MGLIAGFVSLLLLGFWVIGARNRLVRLRQAVINAFPPLELQLRKRHALARHLAEASRLAAHHSRDAIEAVLAAVAQAATAIDTAHGRAARPGPMRQLAAAEEVLATALVVLMPAPSNETTSASSEAVPPTADAAVIAVMDLQERLAQLHPPLDYARQTYNAGVQTYNAALRIAPTTLVAALFRFEPAAMLPRLSKPGG
jgi:LemA protein